MTQAFPFYGAINSLMSSISTRFTAFVIPCLVFIYIYRTPDQRSAAPLPPWKALQVRHARVLWGRAFASRCPQGKAHAARLT